MRLSVILAPGLPAEDSLAGRTAVVIDVLRATTSMITALEAGAKAIYPVSTPEQAWALQGRFDGQMLLGGERGGLRINGFDLGNSPREYTAAAVGGRMLAMTTTNGTGALLEADRQGAGPIYIGCLRNSAVLARRLMREKHDAVFYCAGTGGRVSLDDVLAAGALVSACSETAGAIELTDSARIAQAAYIVARKDLAGALRCTAHGRRLQELGFGEDLDFAAQIGASGLVGQFDGMMVRASGHVLRGGDAHPDRGPAGVTSRNKL